MSWYLVGRHEVLVERFLPRLPKYKQIRGIILYNSPVFNCRPKRCHVFACQDVGRGLNMVYRGNLKLGLDKFIGG